MSRELAALESDWTAFRNSTNLDRKAHRLSLGSPSAPPPRRMVEGLRSNSDDDPHTVAMIKDDDFFSYVDDMALLDAFIDGNPLPGEEEVPIALAASSSGPELASCFQVPGRAWHSRIVTHRTRHAGSVIS
jgi:hypothetical protein